MTVASGASAAVLVTVREVLGSAPREAGARMLVTADGIEGTVGGGHLEHRAIAAARDMIESGEGGRELALPLGPALAQCCGGHVALELRRLGPEGLAALEAERAAERAASPLVALFGAGHVGRAVARALRPLPCRVLWVDPRPGLLPADPPPALEACETPDPPAALRGLPAGAFALVMTHSHPLDLDLVDAALGRPDLAWVGLIGSATKRRRFEGQLRARGHAPGAAARLVCPIGLAGIGGKEPAVIAASVAAQLLMAFEAGARRRGLRAGAAA